MTIFKAILLGLIQGLSEFLPISSTAHLTLAGRAFGLIDPNAPEEWTAFIAVIQLGTLIAVLLYFRRDLLEITIAFLKENLPRKDESGRRGRVPFRQQSSSARLGWYIIIGTLPIVVIGLAVKDLVEGMFTKNLIVIGSSLIGLAVVLEIAERVARFTRPLEVATLKDALAVGFAQAVALIPGASRSGVTITAGLFRGLTREAAARFSFLLSIPAIAASGLLELLHAIEYLTPSEAFSMLIATIVAGISGYWSIAFLLRYLRSRTTRVFVVYRLLLGGAVLLGIVLGYLEP